MAKLSYDFAKVLAEARFSALVDLLDGNQEKALFRLSKFWDTALNYWGDGRQGVPAKIFALDKAWQHLVTVGYADLTEDGSVLARGHKKHFDWLAKKRSAASAGGKASAASRQETTGSAQPQNPEAPPKHSRSTLEAPPKQTRSTEQANSNPSSSSSVSSSVSTKKKKRERTVHTPDPKDEALAQAWFEMASRHSTTVAYGPEWPNTVRKLREIDKLTPQTIEALLEFVNESTFWKTTALSIPNLRVRSKTTGMLKFEMVLLQMREELDRHGLGLGSDEKDPWAGFEEECEKQAGRK